jgi:SAM-dependent methyltransferase
VGTASRIVGRVCRTGRRCASIHRSSRWLYDPDVTEPEPLPDYVLRNRAYWDEINAPRYADPGRRAWAREEFSWGIFGVPESALRALPDDLVGRDVIELGCGTAYISAWLARRGARVTGIDNSAEQLKTARALQAEHGLEFPLIHGNAESVPLPDVSFDLAISEYGVSIWADPYRWIPEAARLLRPDGELVFLVNGTLWMLTVPDTDDAGPAADRLLRPYFGMHRFEWPDARGRVPPRLRGLDPAATREWLRGNRPYRSPSAGGSPQLARPRRCRVGAPLPSRRNLESTEKITGPPTGGPHRAVMSSP